MNKKQMISLAVLLVVGVGMVFLIPSSKERSQSIDEVIEQDDVTMSDEMVGNEPTGIVQTENIRIQAFPTDDSTNDPSFQEFFDDLERVIRERDGDSLIAMMSEDVRCSFGVNDGREGCVFIHELDNPDAEIWTELDRMMKLGALYQENNNTYGIPSVWWSLYDIDYERVELDPYLSYVVIGEDIPVYAETNEESDVIAYATYDLVSEYYSIAQETVPGWLGVAFIDGTFGYIKSEYLYSFIGYRMSVDERDGEWVIRFLVAGD